MTGWNYFEPSPGISHATHCVWRLYFSSLGRHSARKLLKPPRLFVWKWGTCKNCHFKEHTSRFGTVTFGYSDEITPNNHTAFPFSPCATSPCCAVRPCAVRGTLHPLRCQCAPIPSWSSSSQGDPMVPWFDGVVYFRSWVQRGILWVPESKQFTMVDTYVPAVWYYMILLTYYIIVATGNWKFEESNWH